MRSVNFKIAAAAALAAMALAACSSSSKSSSSTTNPPATQAPTTATSAPTGSTASTRAHTVSLATVTVKGSAQQILVDGKGMTLYVNANDKPGKPACTGPCLQAWPPVPAPNTFIAGPGVDAHKYSAVTASDGTKQLSVNGSPLYTWTGDTKPGDATGQGVNHFYVVMASGTKYDPGAAASP